MLVNKTQKPILPKGYHQLHFKYYLFFFIAAVLHIGCGASQMYKTPEHEKKIIEIYNSKLQQLNVEYDTFFVQTKFGATHIIHIGDEKNPFLILLHAMGVTSAMWIDNIEEISRHFNVYAIDMIGDIGKSKLKNIDGPVDDAEKYSEWMNEILDSLKIEKTNFTGASMGGWGVLNFALRNPQRVDKIALLGPMGIPSASFGTIAKILSLVWFPTDEKKNEMIEWTLGSNPNTKNRFDEHMRLAMDCRGFLPTPWTLDDDELQIIHNPILLLLGENDEVAGPTDEVKERAEKYFPNVKVNIIKNAGHMMNTDDPQLINSLLINFLKENSAWKN